MAEVSKKIIKGSGNVFADLGRPEPQEHLLKAQIVAEIAQLLKGRKLTQTQAGELMGISQPEVSRMLRGNFREYSVHRLMSFLTAFDRDVDIVIRRRSSDASGGAITVKHGAN